MDIIMRKKGMKMRTIKDFIEVHGFINGISHYFWHKQSETWDDWKSKFWMFMFSLWFFLTSAEKP